MIWGFLPALPVLLILIPLIILHLRRNRRREIIVSSVLLWDLPGISTESSLRRRFRESLHLLLQILVLTFLILAAANPMIPGPAPGGERVILILDGSASMRAGSGRDSRFRLAVREAGRRLGRGRETAVILAGPEPRLLSGFTSSRRQLTDALSDAKPAVGEADMEASFSMAASLAEGGRAEIVLISDGCFTSPSEVVLPLTFIPVGEEEENLGFTAFNARRDPEVSGRHHIFAAVLNSSPGERRALLRLTIDGITAEEREIILPRDAETQQIFIVDADEGRIELALSGTDGLPLDGFPLDDVVHMVIKEERPLRVLLVSEGNYYLKTLLSLLSGVELSVSERFISEAVFDLVIFEKPPVSALPPGNYIFIGVGSANIPVGLEEEVFFPSVSRWDSSHPIMAGVDPRSFTVYQAYRSVISDQIRGLTETVIESEVPLVTTLDDGQSRAVYLSFPLAGSDLPLRPAFPILFSNILEWIEPAFNPGLYDSRSGGRMITAPGGSGARNLQRPDGSKEEIVSSGGEYRFFAEDEGFYSMTIDGRKYSWAVNLLSANESDLTPRFEAPLRSAEDAGVQAASGGGEYTGLWPWLLLLGGLMLIAERALAQRGLQGAGRRGRAELSLTAAAAVLLAAAAFNPLLPFGQTGLSVIYLLDTSLSITAGEREEALGWIEDSASAAGSLEKTALITFGSEAIVSAAAAPELENLRIDALPSGDETNITVAVRRALSIFPPAGDRRIVLLSDGNETRGDLLSLLSSLNSPGISLHSLPIGKGENGGEVLIRSLTGPGRAAAGEPFSLTVEVESSTAAMADLFLYLDGEYYGEDELELSPGPNQFIYRLRLEDHGYHQIEAVIYSDLDHRYENNRYQKVIFTSGEPPILYLYGGGGRSESLLAILAAQGYRLDVRPAAEFPDSLPELFSYKAAILDNVSAYELTFTEMELLKNAVAGGMGVLVSGGDSSFGLGGYYKTPIESFLPVDVDITSSMDLPDMAILMVIDKSGTMQEGAGTDDQGKARFKIDLAKQAVLAAVEVLEPNHQAAILSFDAEWEWTLPFTGAGELDNIREGLFALKPGGGTVLYPVLEEALRVLTAHSAAVKHVLILSDGHTDQRDFQPLVNQMRAEGITISTVAVGPGSDRNLMEDLARWGEGRAYYAEDIQSVPAIFAGESLKASKRLTVEQTFFPVLVPGHPVLSGLDPADIPPLDGFLLSYLKPEAEALLEGIEGNPLLSVKQYGLGRTAAFTSSLDSPWTEAWNSWDGYPRLFTQLIRWLSRGSSDTGITFSLARSRRGGDVNASAVGAGGGFLNNLSLSAGIITPRLDELEIRLNQTGPGLYSGSFPLTGEGNYFVTLLKEDESLSTTVTGERSLIEPDLNPLAGGRMQGTGVFSIPYAEEFRRLSLNEAFLEKAAVLTGGSILSADEPLGPGFFLPDPEIPSGPFYLRPFLLISAAVLFLTALFFRLLPQGVAHLIAAGFREVYGRLGGNRETEDYIHIKTRMEKEEDSSNSGRNEEFWFGKKE